MLEVFGRRNASNVLPVMWTVGELAIPHARHDVGGSFGGLDTAEYRALNPNGTIPTIRDGDFVMWESNAIVRYLCRRYGQRHLLPDSEADYARADQWMEWCKTTPYPPYIKLFWAIVRTEPALRDPNRIAALARTVGKRLRTLDEQLGRTPFVAGTRISMADVPPGPLVHRYFALDIERPKLANIEAWYARLRERPAYAEHVMFPFGANPAEWYRLETETGRRNT